MWLRDRSLACACASSNEMSFNEPPPPPPTPPLSQAVIPPMVIVVSRLRASGLIALEGVIGDCV